MQAVSISRGGYRPGSGRPKGTPNPPREQQDARTRLEEAKARLAELELDEREGRLMDVAQVRKGVERAAMALRDAMLALPAQLAAQIASLDDEREVEQTLTRAIRSELDRVADGVKL